MQLLKVLRGAVEAAAATASDGSSQDQNCDEATQDHNFDIVQCLLQVLTFVPWTQFVPYAQIRQPFLKLLPQTAYLSLLSPATSLCIVKSQRWICTSKQSSTENKKLGRRGQIHIRFITVIPQPSSKRENLPCEENLITCEKSNTQGAPLLLHADWWWRHEEGWWFNDAKIQTICKAWSNIFLANLCIYLAFCKIIIIIMTSAAMQELRFQHSSANNILTHQIDDRHHGSQDSTDMPPCNSVEPACSQSLYKAKQLGHWKRVFEAGACWFRTCKPCTHILQLAPKFQALFCLWATRSSSQLRNES